MIKIDVPYHGPKLNLKAGDLVEFTGTIYCGRDMVLPKVVEAAENGTLSQHDIDMEGAVIFHTAVSCAGIAPTTSSKPEIQGSIIPLSRHGALFHLGKGLVSQETVDGMKKEGSYFLVTPPVAALLTAQMTECKCVFHPEYGMEGLYKIQVKDFPAIVAAADGETIFAK